jgi:hypothetical protein
MTNLTPMHGWGRETLIFSQVSEEKRKLCGGGILLPAMKGKVGNGGQEKDLRKGRWETGRLKK